jgi:putative transposase
VKSGPQVICVEKLQIRNMTRSAKGSIEEPGTNVAAKSGLNRSILDAGLAQFVRILTDTAESAGRLVVAVDPRGTSQECSDCGKTVAKTLKQRWHSCPCGAEYHRDHNAARNVLQRGVVVPLRQAA